MQESEFHRLIETIVECAPGKIKKGMLLTEVPGWDSLAVIGFISAADRKFGTRIPAVELAKCVTVDDLANLLGDKITA